MERHVLVRWAAAAAFVAGAVAAPAMIRGCAPREGNGPLVEHVEDGLRLVYHVPTGQLGLFDVARDPVGVSNLAHSRPDDAQRLRRALERRLGRRLESLPRQGAAEVEALRGLGYF